ncbi:glycolate oxidase subunit GlcE [Nitrococcus mobilis]|uniref:FAD linked oxidase-like protein n=1 Tax=Nitrococcus mobilis Nb-231 TaxID=314278 RepID=A4BVB9_9GAMM|nr:glycolate oxidase subunit GlcE [Nitrococcus mobilis]EAR20304.1 FAD linked oxidase-like protein [Nitrococcus mobilis Nb-231]
MHTSSDLTAEIAEQIRQANATGLALEILGNATKRFYGRETCGEPLRMTEHRGIVNYEPSELVLTARSGTPLTELTARLAEHDQMLAFEPPCFAGEATLGGAIAAGLAGPRRPFAGSVRDMVLGVRIVNGRGQVLQFGGQVMKNVAGYDLSRLMVGALGTLGVILEVSLKLLPVPQNEQTLTVDEPVARIYELTEQWLRAGVPVSAVAHDGARLYVRLSGAASAVAFGRRRIGGQDFGSAERFWRELRDHRLAFFTCRGEESLWRIVLPAAASPPDLPGAWINDWAGRQIWLRTDTDPTRIRREAQRLGGHATHFRGGDRSADVFQPLDAPLLGLHQRLKQAFDPTGILNPGRLYAPL